MFVFLLPCNLPPTPPIHLCIHTHMQQLKQSFHFLIEHNSFTKSFLNFLLQFHNLLLICPRILRKNNCSYKQKKLRAIRDPVVMFKGKKASGFRKPKQRLKPIASREYEQHFPKTNSCAYHLRVFMNRHWRKKCKKLCGNLFLWVIFALLDSLT